MTNPKDRIGLTKPPLRLVPPALRIHTSLAMANGAAKYGAYNWREHPVRLTIYIEAAMRHLDSLLDGEDKARDSGVLHAGHVAACMAIILDALETGNLIDDRAPEGPASSLIDRLTKQEAPAALEPEPQRRPPAAWDYSLTYDENLDRGSHWDINVPLPIAPLVAPDFDELDPFPEDGCGAV